MQHALPALPAMLLLGIGSMILAEAPAAGVPDAPADSGAATPVVTRTAASAAPRAAEADSLPAAPSSGSEEDGRARDEFPGAAAPPESLVATHADSLALRDVEYLWVLRTALLTPESVDSVVARARAMCVRALLVQVVGRGDAYYRSDLLPRAAALGRTRDPAFDPFDRLVRRAHEAGIEVHAWMNCMLVWSGPHPPTDPRHVLKAHPEWISRLRNGRSMARLNARERKRMRVEGAFLAPAHPGVRTWVARIAREIGERYPVDGIHLDYIRQPDVAVGFDGTTRARFALESGVDPDRFARVPAARRARVDSAWASFQRAQVTATVQQVRDSLRTLGRQVSLSAAVIADTLKAQRVNAQNWCAWVREGLVDHVFMMCYAPSVQTVMNQMVAAALGTNSDPRVVPGLAVYNTSAATAAIKIKGAHALGFTRVALYSYDSLFATPDDWAALRDRLKSATAAGSP